MSFFLDGNARPSLDATQKALKDLGFYHDLSDVKLMYAEYVNNKHYGYDGGVMDQPDAYWADMSTMKWLNIYITYHLPLAGMFGNTSIFDKANDGQPIF